MLTRLRLSLQLTSTALHTSHRNMAIRPTPDSVALRAASSIHQPRDPNTLSNYNAWRTKHTAADFEIDFEQKKLRGSVSLTLKALASEKQIVLDTSYLHVDNVTVAGKQQRWSLHKSRIEPYGTPLTIELDDAVKDEVVIKVEVETTKDCTALQWMTPAQTSNKKHPYMFSQCQAIHARSLLPCQDTPDVKSTFSFSIRSPLPVVASGLATGSRDFRQGKDGKSGSLLYTFHQPVPIPSYLFAIASGDIAMASIGPRSTVLTGPDELTDSQWEFEADTEKFIQVAESIVYPYAWTSYNVLVLPPSFPYGGMENPQNTFATPTLISKDRQNVDVIAHELAHSWSGNLVSCASWEHFWLNEGWTTYLERRIQAGVHKDEKMLDFESVIGWKALLDSVAQFGEDHEFTKLIPDLKGKDPDDAFSSVPYEKGFTFLYYLDKLLGREKWDKYTKQYFTTFKEKSVDSYEWKANLIDFFSNDAEASGKLKDVDWDSWFYKAGLPPKPDFDTTLTDAALELSKKWHALNTGKNDFTPQSDDIKSFFAQQSYVFLEEIQQFEKPLSPDLVDQMGEAYGYAKSENVELVSRYYVVAIKARAKHLYPAAAQLAGRVGRMKFVRPLFRELLQVDAALVKKTFEERKDFYHPICRGMVAKMIENHEKGKTV